MITAPKEDGSEINWVDKEAKELTYLTPENILEAVRKYFGGPIELDPATEVNNPTKALRFFTEADDALNRPWDAEHIFINPPYGKLLKPFIEKIEIEVACDPKKQIIALLPCGARFSTRYWQKSAFCSDLEAICFIKGRVKFLRKDGTVAKQNPYDSQIYGYNINLQRFSDSFKGLGKVYGVTTPL